MMRWWKKKIVYIKPSTQDSALSVAQDRSIGQEKYMYYTIMCALHKNLLDANKFFALRAIGITYIFHKASGMRGTLWLMVNAPHREADQVKNRYIQPKLGWRHLRNSVWAPSVFLFHFVQYAVYINAPHILRFFVRISDDVYYLIVEFLARGARSRTDREPRRVDRPCAMCCWCTIL